MAFTSQEANRITKIIEKYKAKFVACKRNFLKNET